MKKTLFVIPEKGELTEEEAVNKQKKVVCGQEEDEKEQ